MSYRLKFLEEALNEWRDLDSAIQEQLKKKLRQRLDFPEVPASRLAGSPHRYKIKLKSAGYRLVYEVGKNELVVLVIAIGKREKSAVYRESAKRTSP